MAVRTWKRPERDLLTLAALGLLAERPRHAYEIQRELQQRHKEFAAGTPRALYHAVDRLVAGGLIELAETVREGHRPERIVYRATDAGREELQHWLIDLLALPRLEPSAFSAAVSLIGYLKERDALRALLQRVAQLEGRIAAMDAVLTSLLDQFGMPRLFLLEREFERSLWRAELAWVTELIGELRSGALAVDQSWLREHSGESGDQSAESEAPLAVQSPKEGRGQGPSTREPDLTVHQGGAT
ncbi:MAG: PadR family transcriptional regulator [Candidatus Dormiibacterota bacterium]